MSWDTATAYGNPSNHFWRLLRDADILPKSYRTCDTLLRINNLMPAELGIGNTDLGVRVPTERFGCCTIGD